jgi:hypothetical protein
MAVLFNPASPDAEAQVSQIQVAARSIGQQIHVVTASNERDFDAAFASLVQKRAGALFVTGDPLFTTRRTQLVALAAKHAIPASYSFRDLVVAGGLMSYGANLPDVHRQAGVYTGRILKGAKPADLPVLQPTRFDLVIQRQGRQGARHRNSTEAAHPRGRGHRVNMAWLTSGWSRRGRRGVGHAAHPQRSPHWRWKPMFEAERPGGRGTITATRSGVQRQL